MKIKTTDLTGKALDWAVALAVCPESFRDSVNADGLPYWSEGWLRGGSPTTNWEQLGPLVEQFKLTLYQVNGPAAVFNDDTGEADYDGSKARCGEGDTILIAACRAIVAAKIGDEVDVPEGVTQ